MKKVLTLLTLLCMVCTGAWAQVTSITDIAQLEAGVAYNLRCFGGCGSPWMWDDAEASPTLYGHADYGSLFMFEAVVGGYHMKSLSSNKYVNVPNTDNQTLATLDDDASTIWTLVNVGSGIAIRPSGSNYGLNNNQDQDKIKLNASESGNTCSLWKFYKIEQKGWIPNLSNKSIANIGEKATSLTAATSAEDNNHWYLMTQTRGTETPVVSTTSGERIKRSGGAVTQYTTNIQNYLVRLIPAGTTDGYYKLQFGNGLYFGTNQRTFANNTDAAVYSYDSEARASTLRIYNTTGSGTGFGINLTKDGTEYGKTLDNQGNGGNVVFWGQGQKQNNSGNDFWQFYPVELQEGENYVRPTFVSTNSTETGSQGASKLCDENNGNPTGSKWGEAYSANPETKLYAIVRADNTILKEYVMFNGNDTHDWPGRRLTAWTLEGSNSQSGPWTLIDNKTGQTQNDANYGANAYSTESNEAVYSYYKLTLGAIDGNGQHADMFQISDLLFKVEEVSSTQVSYRINDTEGNALFEGYCDGIAGTSINLVGFDGMLSNESWDASAYAATLTYPFAVSTEEVSNYTYISVNNDLTHLLFNSDGNVKMNHNVLPNNGNNDNYKWAIIPSCRDGVLTFKIKNYNGKYIYGTSTTNSNATFALSANATEYSYGTCVGTGKGFYVPGTSYFLSINSPGQQDQNLFIWNKGSNNSHQGSNLKFSEPTDFDALMTRNQEAISTLESTYTLGTGLGEYSANEAYNTAKEALAAVNAGTAFFTKAEFDTNLGAIVAGNLSINQPATGKFYTFKGVQSHKYMTVTNGELKEGSEDVAANIFYVEENGDKVSILSYTTGLYVTGTSLGAVGEKAGFEFGQAHATNGSVLVGEYRVRLNGADLCSWGNGTIQGLETITQNDWEGWTIEEVEELPVNMVEVAGAYYASLHLPVAVTLPAGVKAYTGAVSGDVLTLTLVEEDVLPAWSPVILYSENAVNDQMTITTGGYPKMSDLMGTVSAISAAEGQVGEGAYVLNKSGDNVGFYKTTTKINGFKAYLPAAAVTSGVQKFSFNFNEEMTTAIRAIESENSGAEIFDAAGNRLKKAQKGMNIINGHKVIVK